MEFCDSGSLAGLMSKMAAPLKEDEIAVACFQTASGLRYLHSMHMIHRYVLNRLLLLRVSCLLMFFVQRYQSR